MPEFVRVTVADAVATVTLDRPQARNALNRDMLAELSAGLAALEDRDDVAVAVITGTDPAFCAGLDLHELTTGELDIGELTAAGMPWPRRHKPWIAAVNGVAVTGGLELVLACDVVVCSDRARFADTHARVGIQPFWGLTVALPAAVGLPAARVMSLTGNFVDAETAARWGLVYQVVPHAELLQTALHLAADIATNDVSAATRLATTYREQVGRSVDDALAWEHQTALAWQGSGFGAARIAERIAAVQARGRRSSR